MIDLKALLSISFIVAVIVWRCGPKRSGLWRSIKLWAEDNEGAALYREDRRDARKPRRTETVSDNGREYQVEVR